MTRSLKQASKLNAKIGGNNFMNTKHVFTTSLVDRQNEAEKAMLAEFRAGNYTLENPLVKLNPYFINPLAAVVMFTTEKEVAVRQIWNVSNPYGAFKSFTNKDDAIELANSINNKILEYYI
jgi:hypothetical protein